MSTILYGSSPAGSFTPMDKETKELLAKMKENKNKVKR